MILDSAIQQPRQIYTHGKILQTNVPFFETGDACEVKLRSHTSLTKQATMGKENKALRDR